MDPHSLKALVVFKNNLYPELIRTVHLYKSEKVDKIVEREYVFYNNDPYEEMSCDKVLTLNKFCVSEQFEGLINGVWLCIFVFDADRGCPLPYIPTILSVPRNRKLATVPTLTNDLRIIFELNSRTKNVEIKNAGDSKLKNQQGVALDLNSVPSLGKESEESDSLSGVAEEKKKRANPKDVASLSIHDLSKLFDLPIVEASKILNVGLTVLKRKCREFGIPRWPHRKIKSLDGLIRDLQEEVEQQEREDESAAVAVAMKRRMIESEKESIEKKPFVEIQRETKKFRQDNFKKRHRARAREVRNQATHAIA